MISRGTRCDIKQEIAGENRGQVAYRRSARRGRRISGVLSIPLCSSKGLPQTRFDNHTILPNRLNSLQPRASLSPSISQYLYSATSCIWCKLEKGC